MNNLFEQFDRFLSNSITEELHFKEFTEKKISLHIKRDDLIHPHVSGNKWRKLKYHLLHAQQNDAQLIETYGGAFSNHLLATACAGAVFGFKTIGIVRGEELNVNSNFILKMCHQYGMDLRFINRTDYRIKKHQNGFDKKRSCYIIPEGGEGELGEKGCQEIINEINQSYDYLFLDIGTGTTYGGLLKGIKKASYQTELHGIVVLKSGEYLEKKFTDAGFDEHDLHLHFNYHFGGFGKYNSEQIEFNKYFSSSTGIFVDPIYTGKLFRAIFDLNQKNFFPAGSKILSIHTGGLTGILSDKYLKS